MISAFNYFKAEATLDGSKDENINFVLALFGKNKDDTPVSELNALSAKATEFLNEVKKRASTGKLEKLRKKVGTFKLVENAAALKVAHFIEYADAQTRGDKITMLGIMYGGKSKEECEYICKNISAFEALNVLSFFLNLYKVYSSKTRRCSTAAALEASKKVTP